MPETHPERKPQHEYSDLQPLTKDRAKRVVKSEKIVKVIQHFLGRHDLTGSTALDIGASTGFTVSALAATGATAMGVDIDASALAWARREVHGADRLFIADGSRLPLGDESVDVVVLNHIYEHVVDPDAVLAEIKRVLAPQGVAYLGLGNRLGVMEPHYRLPFLSWLPRAASDHYMRLAGRGDHYYERFRTRRGLVNMCSEFVIWDYTLPVLSHPDLFGARDMITPTMDRIPPRAWRTLVPVLPTYIWVLTPGDRQPGGTRTNPPPRRLTARR
ncbi:class I SAM-dependent methyltransferase [uncultured Nocardioides sp.]|uniref:class I SAM-dependent methyltransferase n=1 Tax=uncultured Nocardioides sp. TaxID=198441 RepID=UPI0026032FCB|nr:class I SAM-dependent methyltransferase [uncultured Nocardioides sp.]